MKGAVCACGENDPKKIVEDCDQCGKMFCKACEFRLYENSGVWVLSYCKQCGIEHEEAQVRFRREHEMEMAMPSL